EKPVRPLRDRHPASSYHDRVRQMVRRRRGHPASRMGQGRQEQFLRKVHRLMEKADIIVGHNVDRADVPWLKGDLHIEAGLPPLPPFKTVDTLKVMRREFGQGAPFKSLDAFC